MFKSILILLCISYVCVCMCIYICTFYESWAFSILVWAMPYILATFKHSK